MRPFPFRDLLHEMPAGETATGGGPILGPEGEASMPHDTLDVA